MLFDKGGSDSRVGARRAGGVTTQTRATRRVRRAAHAVTGLVVLLIAISLGAASVLNAAEMPSTAARPAQDNIEEPTVTPRPNGELLLEDRFEGTTGAAPLFGSTHMTFRALNGQGQLVGNTPNVVLPAMYAAPAVKDLFAEFDLIPPAVATDSSYGLIFRSDDAPGGLAFYYLVGVNPKKNAVEFSCWKEQRWQVSDRRLFAPGLVKPGESNRVRIEALASDFRVFLNGVLVYQRADSLLSSQGIMGLSIGTGSTVPDTVLFDNLIVYAPGSSPAPTNPTPGPVVAPTANASAAVAAAPVTCPVTGGGVYWSDDFGNPQSGWTEYSGADYSHFYKDGEFHFAVTAQDKTGNAWILLRDLGTRYQIQVRTRKLGGPNLNSYGIVFGGQDDNNYYAFRLADTGFYRIAKQEAGTWKDLVPWTGSAAIQQGGVNTLTLIVDGAQIYACANEQWLGTASDTALKSGRIGMVLGAYDEPTHVHFDDFSVRKLEGAVVVAQAPSAPPPTASNAPAPTAIAPNVAAPTAIAPNVPPGVYLTALRTEPAKAKRNEGVGFVGTFLNTTGAPQNFDWVIMVYEPDARKAFGETDVQGIAVPAGVSELVSAANWTVRGPGGCVSLYARPYFQNPDTSRTPFKQTDGSDLTLGFEVCP